MCGLILFIHSPTSTVHTLQWECDCLSMLKLKLNHVNKRGPQRNMKLILNDNIITFRFSSINMRDEYLQWDVSTHPFLTTKGIFNWERYICNVFSHWLRPCLAIDRKGQFPQTTTPYLRCWPDLIWEYSLNRTRTVAVHVRDQFDGKTPDMRSATECITEYPSHNPDHNRHGSYLKMCRLKFRRYDLYPKL